MLKKKELATKITINTFDYIARVAKNYCSFSYIQQKYIIRGTFNYLAITVQDTS